MKQQLASEQRRPRAGRWFVRALLVVGGAVAGTAAAWAISTATASAETALPQDPAPAQQHDALPGQSFTPTTDALVGAADHVTLGSSELAGRVAGTTVQYGTGGDARTPEATHRGQQVAADVKHAMHRFAGVVIHPAHRVLGMAEHVARQPQDAPRVIQQAITPPPGFLGILGSSGSGLAKLLHAPVAGDEDQQARPSSTLPAPAAVVLAPAVPAGPMGPVLEGPLAHHPFHKPGHDVSAGGRSHGLQTVKLPYDPTRGPLVPSGVPSVPGGSATGGHLDGPLLGVPAGPVTVAGAPGPRAARFGIRHTTVEPGEQPGVTPD